jgi:hypothetical protein
VWESVTAAKMDIGDGRNDLPLSIARQSVSCSDGVAAVTCEEPAGICAGPALWPSLF